MKNTFVVNTHSTAVGSFVFSRSSHATRATSLGCTRVFNYDKPRTHVKALPISIKKAYRKAGLRPVLIGGDGKRSVFGLV